MREQFRDVSPEDADLQPIIEGLLVNTPLVTATTFKGCGSRADRVVPRRRGCLSFWSAMARSSPPGRISPSTNIPQRSNVSGRIKRCASRLAARVVQELERRAVLAGYSHIYLTTGFRQPEAVRLYLSRVSAAVRSQPRPGRVQPAAVRRSAAFHQDADPRSAQQNRIRSDDEQR